MKTALAILLLSLSFTANADWIARANTTKGGQIVLLDEKGPCSAGLRMYVATAEGRIMWGCYATTDLHIHAMFDEGGQMAYDYKGWEMNPNRQQSRPAGRSTF